MTLAEGQEGWIANYRNSDIEVCFFSTGLFIATCVIGRSLVIIVVHSDAGAVPAIEH